MTAVGAGRLGGVGVATVPGGCDVETVYHCAEVADDPERASGRTLVLDGLRHSYVDLDDPTHLEFAYVQAIATVADTAFRPGGRCDATTWALGATCRATWPRCDPAPQHGLRDRPRRAAIDRDRLGLDR